ncbi:MAG: prephenate dehydrogenase [Clostridia bacterium]|nr:prephenate dehydrogenase [Clostridia bacterium]
MKIKNLSKESKILIIGLGVIGGSYAKALKSAGYKVSCITKNPEDIEYAYAHGMIDYGTCEIEESLVRGAELIVFALYPTVFVEWVKGYGHLFSKGTLITDVSGVKSLVVYEVQSLLPDGVEFISAHPMAGRERSGVEYSDPAVFVGANYIVTPTERNTEEAVEICKELGRVLGFSRITTLSPEEHDKMIAFLSQLTHCIAVVLMNANDSEGLEKYTGDSFRDLTRIAKINDKMWSELFLMNKDALLREMDAFIEEFTTFRTLLAEGDGEKMREKMRRSTERRSLFDKPKAN